MSIPYPNDPAALSEANPLFNDNAFVRGDQQRLNNQRAWANFNVLDDNQTSFAEYVIDYLAALYWSRGRNNVRFSFSSAVLTVVGVSEMSGLEIHINNTASPLTITGSARWVYIVVDPYGVVTFENVPGGEIVSNVLKYTPTPAYGLTTLGYYSSVTGKRIIGIAYFDATNITSVRTYGNCQIKNDDYIYKAGGGTDVTTDGSLRRLEFSDTMDYINGDSVVTVNNGPGTSDANGFRITAQKNGMLIASIGFELAGDSGGAIQVRKNAASFIPNAATASDVTLLRGLIPLHAIVDKGDYFTFAADGNGSTARLQNILIQFREF